MSGCSTMYVICILVLVGVEGYQKSNMGSLCSNIAYEIQTEQECISACQSLGITYLGSWDGAGDFPKCTFTEGLNKVCHFNTNSSPGRTNVNSKYSAICLECADIHPKGTTRCEARKAKGECATRPGIQRKCALTCAICTADSLNIATFQKATMGTLCNPQTLELETEQECINACNALGYPYLGSWNGPGDFPKCTFTEGLNRVCHFNTSPVPGRTNVNSQYAAICKTA